MAVDMFLELDGIKGESVDKTHKGKIDVLAYSWGLSNTGTFHISSGGGSGKANFQDISITKYVDAASSDLMLACASGKHIAKGKLIVRKAGETPLEYVVFEFNKLLVTSLSTGASTGEERLTENASFNFAEVKHTYTAQKPEGGKGDTFPFGWNIAENTKL